MTESEWQEWELRITNIMRRELAALIDVLEVRAERERAKMPQPETPHDRLILDTVAELWRNTHRPIRTADVAYELGYTPQYTLDILKDAAARGLIVLLPGRGSRCSGLWKPVQASNLRLVA